jgi:hypothetical protein
MLGIPRFTNEDPWVSIQLGVIQRNQNKFKPSLPCSSIYNNSAYFSRRSETHPVGVARTVVVNLGLMPVSDVVVEKPDWVTYNVTSGSAAPPVNGAVSLSFTIPDYSTTAYVFIKGKISSNNCEFRILVEIVPQQCNVGSAEFIRPEWIADFRWSGQEFDEVIEFTGITPSSVEVDDLPVDITYEVVGNTIQLHSDALPNFATVTFRVSGRTTLNNCFVSLTLSMGIRSCGVVTAPWLYSTLPTETEWEIDEYSEYLFKTNQIDDLELLDKPAWMLLEIVSGDPNWDLFYKLSGTPDTCEGFVDTPAGKQLQMTFSGIITDTPCQRTAVTIAKLTGICPEGCPPPDNFTALGASITALDPGSPRVFRKSGSLANLARFSCTDCDEIGGTFENLPEGIYQGSPGVWFASDLWFTGSPLSGVANGVYIILCNTTVTSGPHTGCPIQLAYEIEVVD